MIEDLKALLGLPEEIDGALENKLLLILKATKQRLRFLLGGLEPPEEMNYIILDTIYIPVEVDGRQVAKATAKYTKEEIEQQQKRDLRKKGMR